MVCASKFLIAKENARIVFTNSSSCQNDVDIFCGKEKLPSSEIAELQGEELNSQDSYAGNIQKLLNS